MKRCLLAFLVHIENIPLQNSPIQNNPKNHAMEEKKTVQNESVWFKDAGGRALPLCGDNRL